MPLVHKITVFQDLALSLARGMGSHNPLLHLSKVRACPISGVPKQSYGGIVQEPLTCLISGMVPLFPQEYLLTFCCSSSQSSTKIYLSSFSRSPILHLHIPSLTHTCISPILMPQFLCYSYSGPQSPVQLINLISHSLYITFIFSSISSPILLLMPGI